MRPKQKQQQAPQQIKTKYINKDAKKIIGKHDETKLQTEKSEIWKKNISPTSDKKSFHKEE